MGKLRRGQRRKSAEGNAIPWGVCETAGSCERHQRLSETQKGMEGTGKKLITEGVDEADYACYALRKYGIRPGEWAEMTIPERMFCCAAIELEIEAMQR